MKPQNKGLLDTSLPFLQGMIFSFHPRIIIFTNPNQHIVIREIPKNYHGFVLFDSTPKCFFLKWTPATASFQDLILLDPTRCLFWWRKIRLHRPSVKNGEENGDIFWGPGFLSLFSKLFFGKREWFVNFFQLQRT